MTIVREDLNPSLYNSATIRTLNRIKNQEPSISESIFKYLLTEIESVRSQIQLHQDTLLAAQVLKEFAIRTERLDDVRMLSSVLKTRYHDELLLYLTRRLNQCVTFRDLLLKEIPNLHTVQMKPPSLELIESVNWGKLGQTIESTAESALKIRIKKRDLTNAMSSGIGNRLEAHIYQPALWALRMNGTRLLEAYYATHSTI